MTRDAAKWMDWYRAEESNFECDFLEIRISLKIGFAHGATKISIRISADDTTVIRKVNKWQQINYN